ncbi:MAG: hypothetical protein EB059_10880 [Alphaproteobacteria bacterium]|nr:hypothetical protein [Alphaproteobacteria bacterium]
MNTKQEQVALYGQLAMIYGKQLTPQALVMMVDALDDLPGGAVIQVMKAWVKKQKHFPMPSDIRESLSPTTDAADDGRDIASRVIAAVSKFGSYQAEAAKNHIGEIGWECVQRMGGWKTFCSELTEDTKGIFNAQIRDLAMTLKKKALNGTLDQPQNFPTPIESGDVRKLIGDFTNKGGV